MERLAKILIIFVAVCGAFIVLAIVSDHWQRTHRRSVIEQLKDPTYLALIRKDGLVDMTGKVILPPEISAMPVFPGSVTRDLYKYGVEVQKDGNCVGLMQVHHWCGNDPVGFHLARVDIARLSTAIDSGLIQCTQYGIEPGSYSWLQNPVEVLRESKE